jgi:hypothetical protein
VAAKIKRFLAAVLDLTTTALAPSCDPEPESFEQLVVVRNRASSVPVHFGLR